MAENSHLSAPPIHRKAGLAGFPHPVPEIPQRLHYQAAGRLPCATVLRTL
jgi:hypothetical protein